MAFKTVYDRNGNYITQLRNLAMKDPLFALGDVIGSALSGAYANNYNNRGINKAVDKAMAEYGTSQNNGQQPVGGVGEAGLTEMDALNNIRQNMGLDGTQPVQNAISVGNVPQMDTQQMAAMLAPAQNAQPETPEQAVARLAQTPGAGIIARDNLGRSMDNFNANEALMRAQQQMLKDGRTPYQIEQAMEILKPHFTRMQDDAYRAQADRIMADLNDDQKKLSDAEYKQKIVELARLGDYGKNAANIYGRDIISGKERWTAQQQAERERIKAAQRATEKAQDYAFKKALNDDKIAAYGRNGYSSGSKNAAAKSPLASEEFKYIENTLKAIDEIPEEDRTAQQKQFYGTYKPLRDEIVRKSIGGAFGYYGAPAQQPGNAASGTFNPNDYNQAVATFRKFAQRGNFKKEDVAKYIRQKYGLKPDDTSNNFVESIIREL